MQLKGFIVYRKDTISHSIITLCKLYKEKILRKPETLTETVTRVHNPNNIRKVDGAALMDDSEKEIEILLENE